MFSWYIYQPSGVWRFVLTYPSVLQALGYLLYTPPDHGLYIIYIYIYNGDEYNNVHV